MSDAHSTSTESPIAKAMNYILMLGVPAFLLVMLGLTGFFFVAGMGDTDEQKAAAEAEIAAAAAAPAPAPAPPGDGGKAAPPAAPAAAAAGGLPEGVTEEFWALGKSTYATCAACHGADAKGLQAGPALMAPSMVGSPILNGDPDAPILVVLKGIQKESMDYMGIMAALGAGLSDEQIAAVLTYTRNHFGNSSGPVSVEQVAAAREKFADVNAPAGVKRAEIESVVASKK